MIADDDSVDAAARAAVRSARIVFAYSDYVDLFFDKVAPQIENRFVLITNGGDHEVGERFRATLDGTPGLARWFAIPTQP